MFIPDSLPLFSLFSSLSTLSRLFYGVYRVYIILSAAARHPLGQGGAVVRGGIVEDCEDAKEEEDQTTGDCDASLGDLLGQHATADARAGGGDTVPRARLTPIVVVGRTLDDSLSKGCVRNGALALNRVGFVERT